MNSVRTSMLPFTRSTDPVSATDAIPSFSTIPADTTKIAVVSSAEIDWRSTPLIFFERPARYVFSALFALRSRTVSIYS